MFKIKLKMQESPKGLTLGSSTAEILRTLQGDSAYKVWLARGNKGSEQDFLDSLKGKNYILTEPDKQEIARQAAEMVEIPEIPDIPEGVATEGWVKEYAQPKGEYISKAQLEEAVAGSGSGITTAHANSLWAILQKTAFTSQLTSAEISAFKTAWGIGGSVEPDTPVVPEVTLTSISATYTGGDVATGTAVTALTGITVTATYSDGTTATVTGYTLSGDIVEGENTITVSYGGMTTTFTVTGIVESGGDDVTAELVTDGLLGYWDFRNPTEPVVQDWHWAYPSNEGTGGLYLSAVGGSKGTNSLPTFDANYGTTNNFYAMSDDTTYPNVNAATSFGTEFTVVRFTKGDVTNTMNGTFGVVHFNFEPNWIFKGLYNTSDGTAVTGELGSGNEDNVVDYNFIVKRVNGTEMKVIMDSSHMLYDGTTYENFVSWYDKVNDLDMGHANNSTSVAIAIYNRALTDAEIESIRAFMKTLEVN